MSHSTSRRAGRQFARDLIAAFAALAAVGVMADVHANTSGTEALPSVSRASAAPGAPASNAGPVKRNFTVEGYRKDGDVTARESKPRNLPNSKARNARAGRFNTGFGVFDGFAEIYFDDDADGHFYGLDVFMDVDTDFQSAFVYAALYLSLNGGPWELYYTTADFEINGAISDDEYLVQTELFEGYPTGFYDVLIEIYDADFGTFVAEFGPDDSAALLRLPLEDQVRDTPVAAGSGFVVVDTVGGGGATGAGLALLALLGFARRRIATVGNHAMPRASD